jgi:hypothetical protein
MAPHSKGDDLRDPLEIEKSKLKDPLILFKSANAGHSWIEEVENDVNTRLQTLLGLLGVTL